MKQAEVAPLLGTDQGTLSKIIKGKQSLMPEMALAAANLLDVRAGWIMFGEGDTPAQVAKAMESGRRAGWQEAADLLATAAQSPTRVAGGTLTDALQALLFVNVAAARDPHQAPEDRIVEGG